MRRSAVLFDLGGVVLGSPLHAIRDYEAELGLDRNAINRVAADTAPTGAWSRLERGELEMEAFYPAFEADCLAAGIEMDAREMMGRMAASSEPRPMMLEAIRLLREADFRVGALTNNWAHTGDDERPQQNDGTRALKALFDVFIESSVEGLRKPDPRIYELACDRMGKRPHEMIFLDDIGPNLKPPRAMGMATIKVETPEQALGELAPLVGLSFRTI
ncbi:MAG: HAD family phosphatase [bacterium]|nr:HAD family phosphatase [bacterium]